MDIESEGSGLCSLHRDFSSFPCLRGVDDDNDDDNDDDDDDNNNDDDVVVDDEDFNEFECFLPLRISVSASKIYFSFVSADISMILLPAENPN